jgi:DNA-binding NarL/FixJ family response regulator
VPSASQLVSYSKLTRAPPPSTSRGGETRPILALVARGLSSLEIAERLKVERRTIETHRKNIMAKLDAKNVAQLVTIAIGLIDVHDVMPSTSRGDD